MDYSKINTVDIDGDGNIILQDVTGQNITVNYNDTKEFGKLISLANNELIEQIKTVIKGKENTNKVFMNILSQYFDLPIEIKTFKDELKTKINRLHTSISLDDNFENCNSNWLINGVVISDRLFFKSSICSS